MRRDSFFIASQITPPTHTHTLPVLKVGGSFPIPKAKNLATNLGQGRQERMKIPSLRPGSFSKPSGSQSKQEVVPAFEASSRGLKASPWSWKERGSHRDLLRAQTCLGVTQRSQRGKVVDGCLRNSWGGYWGDTQGKTKERRTQRLPGAWQS